MSILKNHTIDFKEEYRRLLDTQEFDADALDYSILDRHIESLSHVARISNCGVTIFDCFQRKHVFASYNFPHMFNYDMKRIETEDSDYFTSMIHPDDIPYLNRNGAIGLRYAIECGERKFDSKFITEYRINISGRYVRCTEQFSVLETDAAGNVWLTLSILEISPDQTPFEKVESRLVNFKTAEVSTLPHYAEYPSNAIRLTQREKDILMLVRSGLLSKEISEQLSISVHTVNTYRQRIIEKLNVNNSNEAIRMATKLGILE